MKKPPSSTSSIYPLSVFALTALMAGCGPWQSRRTARLPAQQTQPSIQLGTVPERLYAAPTLGPSGEWAEVNFHLTVHNRDRRGLAIDRVTVSYEGLSGHPHTQEILFPDVLSQRLRRGRWLAITDRLSFAAAHRVAGRLRGRLAQRRLPSGDSATLPYLNLRTRLAHLPQALRIIVQTQGGHKYRLYRRIHRYAQKTYLRLPVEGLWVVSEGHRLEEHHSAGWVHSQQFAYDLHPASQHASPRVLAAADGRVVRVQRGRRPGLEIGRVSRTTWRRLLRDPTSMAGNYVVLQHGENEYSAYFHLHANVLVEEGQQIQSGQPIGQIGNSGNSLRPHLHFQLQDQPEIFSARGLPARFGDYSFDPGLRSWTYVSTNAPMPLPTGVTLESGRHSHAIDIEQVRNRLGD